MTSSCKSRLEEILISGTKLNKKISSLLLDNNIEFAGVEELSKLIDVPISSLSRFAKKINYPSFKHFLHEYKGNVLDNIVWNEKKPDNQKIEDIINMTSGKIYIITSKRSRAIGFFMHERLNDGSVENFIYHDDNNGDKNMPTWISQIKKNDTLILVDLSGYSYVVSKAIQCIAEKPQNARPVIIIITAAKYMKVFTKYPYIYVTRLTSTTFNDDRNWTVYNSLVNELMPTIGEILNGIYYKYHNVNSHIEALIKK